MLSILVIEGDGLLCGQLPPEVQAQPGLVSCGDIDAGLDAVRTHRFDLILIGSDDGEETRVGACVDIRSSLPNADTPILVVCPRTDESGVAEALDAGADDYVSSCVGQQELLARIRALLRRLKYRPRASDDGKSLLSCRGLTMDLGRRRVQVGTRDVRLTVKEFEILATLLRASGSVVTRERLLSDVWPGMHSVNPRNVDAVMKRLRRKLTAKATKPRIVTVRGYGYRIIDG